MTVQSLWYALPSQLPESFIGLGIFEGISLSLPFTMWLWTCSMDLSEEKLNFTAIIFLLHVGTMIVTIRAIRNVNIINSHLLSNPVIGFLING